MPLLQCMVAWKILTLNGASILPYLERLAALRIAVFREWPYLYEGSAEYERGYLQRYVDCEESVVVFAFAGDQIVGASTGLPLGAADDDFRQAFAGSDYPMERVFYCGESVLLPTWRGRGIGRRFYEEREVHARSLGAAWSAFCAVDRAADDVRRPPAYRDLGPFWRRLGYQRKDHLKASFSWREVDAEQESEHAMTFWLKQLI